VTGAGRSTLPGLEKFLRALRAAFFVVTGFVREILRGRQA
jgi:hypothetical protein